jgi:hypothetical protein
MFSNFIVHGVIYIIILISINVLCVKAMHESFNFALLPGTRSCFYEDFDSNTPMKIIDVFVQSGGSLDVLLSVHGPLTLDQIRKGQFEDPFYLEKVDAVNQIGTDTSTFIAEFKPEK